MAIQGTPTYTPQGLSPRAVRCEVLSGSIKTGVCTLFIGLAAATHVALAGAGENSVAQVDVLEEASFWVWHTLAFPEMQHAEAHRLAWGERRVKHSSSFDSH